jgi:glycosyltransferase involved in cell wall biosynthesis
LGPDIIMRAIKPRVSIGLPVYNGENYLEKSLESLQAQTFSEFELIISDNASNDRTREICLDYASRDRRIQYHHIDINVGGANNFNQLAFLASGEYFKWAAHDDLCAPQFVEKCIEVLENDPSTVLCYPRTILIDERGTAFGKYADGLHLQDPQAHRRLHQFFDTQGLCHAVYGLIRHAPLMTTRLEGNYAMADRVLLAELTLRGKIYELPDELFYRRIHPLISTKVASSESELAAWYLSGLKGKILLPKWRRLWAYISAIERTPLNAFEKGLCYLQILRFSLIPARWKSLTKEVLDAGGLAVKNYLFHG